MTIDISNNNPRVSYSVAQGVTQTSFAVPFEFFDDSDVKVYVDGELQTITTDYTISGGDGSTGTISMSVTGGAGGSIVVLIREITIERTTDFTAGADINRAALNTQLDTLTGIAADTALRAGRSIQLSEFDEGELVLPVKADRLNKFIAFDSNGDLETLQTVGEYKGDWSAVTEYFKKDLVKDSTNDNIYISQEDHTSSEVFASDINSGKWALLVDAAAAATSAANAAASETAAATSESNAAASELAAATSETNAAASETAAAASEGAAASSETAAAASEAAASASESAAASSESAAATSATNAADSASDASVSQAEAATSATNAATSASNAANSATAAATSETNAANSATAAASSATDASSSATSAATQASNAQAAADSALAALDSFDDRYLGQKTSDPTTDNDGDPLVAGALYFNTTDDVMKVYEGSVWVAAYASLSGALTVANNLSDVADVAASRTNLGLGTAATTNSTDYATAAQGALADSAVQPNDSPDFAALNVNGTVTADGLTVDGDASINSAVQSSSTTNQLTLRGGTGNVAIGHVVGGINFDSFDLGNQNTAASITAIASGGHISGNTLDTDIVIKTADGVTPLTRANFAYNGDISFYEDTGTTPKFFWDASTERLGIGTSSPAGALHVAGGITRFTNTASNWLDINASSAGGNDVIIETRGNSMIFNAAAGFGTPLIRFNTGGTERLRIDNAGNVGIGTTSPATELDVNGTVTANSWSGGELSQATWETGTSTTETIVSPAKIKAAIDANAGGVGSVVAWVNFNGIGTISIRESGNVSSVTDNGTGRYTVNFATALQDANYVVAGTHMRRTTSGAGSQPLGIMLQRETVPSTTNVPVESIMNNSPSDSAYMHIVVIR